MNASTYRFTLDLQKHNSQMSIAVFRNDNAVKLCISLTDGGNPYKIGDGCTAIFYGEQPNKEPLIHNCIIEDNTRIIYEFNEATAREEGIVNCQIRLYNVDKKIISAPKFIIVVHENLVPQTLDLGDESLSKYNLSAWEDILLTEKAREDAHIAREERIAALEATYEGKVDKTAEVNKIYGTKADDEGNVEQTTYDISDSNTPGVAMRSEGGHFELPEDPSESQAVRRDYVDAADEENKNSIDNVKKKLDEYGFLTRKAIPLGDKKIYTLINDSIRASGVEVEPSEVYTGFSPISFDVCAPGMIDDKIESVTSINLMGFNKVFMNADGIWQLVLDEDGFHLMKGNKEEGGVWFEDYGKLLFPEFTESETIATEKSVDSKIESAIDAGTSDIKTTLSDHETRLGKTEKFFETADGESLNQARDTLIEIQKELASDDEGAAAMAASIEQNRTDIVTLNGDQNTEGSVAKKVSDAIKEKSESDKSTYETKQNAKTERAKKVDRITEAHIDDFGVADGGGIYGFRFGKDGKMEDVALAHSASAVEGYLVRRGSGGHIAVPDATENSPSNAAVSKKYVDEKVLDPGKVAAFPNSIVKRTENGDTIVPLIPSVNSAATSREYVDSLNSSIEKRVENLESATLTYFEDSTTAYEKAVPEGYLPNAVLTKLGGASKASKNLFNPHDKSLNVNEDGSVTITVGANAGASIPLGEVEAGTYYIGVEYAKGSDETYIIFNDESNLPNEINNSYTYSERTSLSLDIDNSMSENPTAKTITIKIMLAESSTAVPYEPYIDGIQDARVSKIESIGENLYDGDAEVILKGVPVKKTIFDTLIEGASVLSWKFDGEVPNAATVIQVTDADGTVFNIQTRDYTYYKVTNLQKVTVVNWNSLTGKLYDIQITRGTIAPVEYKPFTVLSTLEIPEDIRTRDDYGKGINEKYYNYYEFKDERVYYHKVIEELTIYNGNVYYGTDTTQPPKIAKNGGDTTTDWMSNGVLGKETNLFIIRVSIPNEESTDKYVTRTILTDRFDRVYINSEKETENIGIDCYPSSRGYFVVAIRPENAETFTTITSFRNYMASRRFTAYLALSTPEVTDITHLFPKGSNIFKTEGNGTWRFVNEHNMAVPNSILYVNRKE